MRTVPSSPRVQVSRQSTSELELDAVAADIINHQDVTGAAMNPGLVALWEDERCDHSCISSNFQSCD